MITMLERMLDIRRFEERLAKMFLRGDIPGWVHLYIGQEASAVGVCASLREDDRITSTHRGHGHLIAKGADMARMMAELLGRVGGMCSGKGGSMHIVDFRLGIMGTNGIVGGGMPIAAGAALADTQLGTGRVTACFFGDGAANQGVFLETLNLAAVWRLPVVFICENNGYGEWTRSEDVTAGVIADRGAPLGVPGVRVDGNDVVAVHDVATRAIARARAGDGPSIVETITYRWHGHNEGEEAFAGSYRSREEQAQWRAKDPIERFCTRLRGMGVLDDRSFAAIDAAASARVEDAVAFAAGSARPTPEEAFTDVYAPLATAAPR
jgi:acetoin:2,6-dichlorophenolindophenol oxidoreductase subunit alpha